MGADISAAIFSIIESQLSFNDSIRPDDTMANLAREEQNVLDLRTYSCIAIGIPIILGNSYYQHWMMTLLSFAANLGVAVYWILIFGIGIPTREDFLSDPVDFFFQWALTIELFSLVVAYLILFISWILKKPRDFFLSRQKRYVAVVRKMLHPLRDRLDGTAEAELRVNIKMHHKSVPNLRDETYAEFRLRQRQTHAHYGWLRRHFEVAKYLGRQVFKRRPRFLTDDSFYFPQRLMIACTLSFFAIFLLSCGTILLGRRAAIFVYTVVYLIWDNPAATTLFWVTHYCSFGIVAIGCMVTLWNWIHIFKGYKTNILNMRRGKYFFERGAFQEFNAPRYVGFQLCHTICQYIAMVSFAVIVVLSCFVFYLAPALLSKVRDVAISSGITLAATIIVRRFLNTLVFYADHGTLIDNFRWFSWYDYAWIFFNSVAGITLSIVRYVVGIIIASIRFGRVDVTIIPHRPMLQPFDIVYITYVASAMIDHQSNNPILSVAVDLFVDMIKKRDESKRSRAPARLRAHNRWWLFIVLTNNPSLIQSRKRNLYLIKRVTLFSQIESNHREHTNDIEYQK
eukprot:TRINITY_DN1071_c0_g3_i1.p1 TRINITY_DN1071_c0_g3~~TRINITY_DN1071_c0_g3_i1.p1  ORF type:complete len:668 (+),score=97.15 TRINITY_DN1071_c0_g3_i1:301-2004(+)